MLYPRALTLTLACVLAASGCTGNVKEAPIDLESQASPVATDFSAEATLGSRLTAEILPFYESNGHGGTFAGVAGVPINYRVFETAGEKAAIVLLPGRTEPILKYAEVITDLTRQGYSVYAMDHRGQGASGRMLSNPQIGYVEYFKDYVDDVHSFVTSIVKSKPHPKLFLLAHSMGGAIGAMYLYEHPETFDAAVLSSPMIGINTGAFPSSVALDISATDCGFSDGSAYAIGQADYDPTLKFEDAANDVTRSRARFDAKMRMFDEHPELRLGGVSYRWLCESVMADSHLQKVGDESATPTLLFQAGNDDIVRLDAEDAYCDAAARCQKTVYPDAYHEILMERDAIRNDALTKTVRFFDHFAATTE